MCIVKYKKLESCLLLLEGVFSDLIISVIYPRATLLFIVTGNNHSDN